MSATTTQDEVEQTPGLGHNQPPLPEVIADQLAVDFAATMTRTDELLGSAAEWLNRKELTIEEEGDLGDFLKQLRTFLKETDAVRVDQKKPYDNAADAVHNFFKRLMDAITEEGKKLNALLTTAKIAREAKERAAREEAARKAREEEERKQREAIAAAEAAERERQRLAAAQQADVPAAPPAVIEQRVAAAETKEVEATGAAAAATQIVQQTERAATASTQSIVRTRGSLGSVATIRKTKKFRITDASVIPREYLMPDEEKIKIAMKRNQPIDGVEYYDDVSSLVR